MKKKNLNRVKTLLTVMWISACCYPLQAQDSINSYSSNRYALTISAGPSIPFSDFNSRVFTTRAGFAKAGANLNLDLIHYGRRGFVGLFADVGIANIFFDEKNYITEYTRILGDEGTTTATTGSYQFLKAHGGFLVRFPEFLNTRIILQTSIGYTLCRHPSLSVTNSYWGVINTVNSDLDIQISSSAGIKVEHSLNEWTGIQVSYNLFACLPDFRDSEGFREYTFYLPVRYQNINIGLTRFF